MSGPSRETLPLERGPARTAAIAGFGLLFGYALSRIGFTSFAEVQKMFLFRDLRLLLSFCTAVAILLGALRLVPVTRRLPKRPVTRAVMLGGVLFGLGWALCGACPGVLFAQLGEGRWPALFTLAGALAGAVLYKRVLSKYVADEGASCG